MTGQGIGLGKAIRISIQESARRLLTRKLVIGRHSITLEAHHQTCEICEQCAKVSQQRVHIGWAERVDAPVRPLHSLICAHQLLVERREPARGGRGCDGGQRAADAFGPVPPDARWSGRRFRCGAAVGRPRRASTAAADNAAARSLEICARRYKIASTCAGRSSSFRTPVCKRRIWVSWSRRRAICSCCAAVNAMSRSSCWRRARLI